MMEQTCKEQRTTTKIGFPSVKLLVVFSHPEQRFVQQQLFRKSISSLLSPTKIQTCLSSSTINYQFLHKDPTINLFDLFHTSNTSIPRSPNRQKWLITETMMRGMTLIWSITSLPVVR
jgi:hypothetical protein